MLLDNFQFIREIAHLLDGFPYFLVELIWIVGARIRRHDRCVPSFAVRSRSFDSVSVLFSLLGPNFTITWGSVRILGRKWRVRERGTLRDLFPPTSPGQRAASATQTAESLHWHHLASPLFQGAPAAVLIQGETGTGKSWSPNRFIGRAPGRYTDMQNWAAK